MKNNLILSTCGTSVLTNSANGNESLRNLLFEHTNVRKADEIDNTERKRIEDHIQAVKVRFLNTTINEARKLSSELNGILAYYNNRPDDGKADTHYLLATDTWLCGAASKIIAAWLKANNLNVSENHQHSDLQTKDLEYFNSSLSTLVKWCNEICCRNTYHVVFNLSAGFKSETGFLQALGMFYADEIVYIFEHSNELMRIPRLPIEMDAKGHIEGDLHDFRRASNNLDLNKTKEGIYWNTIEGQSIISPWGELVFKKYQKELYKLKLYGSISEKVVMTESFYNSCKREAPAHFVQINDKIDQLARFMELGSEHNLNSLDLKQLKGNPVDGSTHECDAWHDGSAKRIFLHYEDGKIILDRLGVALH